MMKPSSPLGEMNYEESVRWKQRRYWPEIPWIHNRQTDWLFRYV